MIAHVEAGKFRRLKRVYDNSHCQSVSVLPEYLEPKVQRWLSVVSFLAKEYYIIEKEKVGNCDL